VYCKCVVLEDLEKFNLPEVPGVYFFLGNEGEILYIGKATNLKDRVRSYFSNDLLTARGSHILTMVTLASSLKFETTRSVLEALLLESELIKKHQPTFNTKEKDDKSYFVLVVTEEDFPRVLLMRKRTLDKEVEKGLIVIKKTFGPYASGEHACNALKLVRRIFPFRDRCQPYSASDPKRLYKTNKCFAFELGLCPGVCRGIMNKKQYQKHIGRLVQFLEGDGEGLRRNLEKSMKEASDAQEFEEAQKIKETLFCP
jgi:excinuclease ABC subunit C